MKLLILLFALLSFGCAGMSANIAGIELSGQVDADVSDLKKVTADASAHAEADLTKMACVIPFGKYLGICDKE